MISVVIPLYNKEKSIASTLQSVYEQTYTDYEVVIVNDGSTDNSANVVKDFIARIDDRCIANRWTLINKPNGGVCSARNRGIEEAKGEYVALLDGDDIWDKEYLAEQMKMIRDFPEAAMWGINFAETNDGKLVRKLETALPEGYRGYVENYFHMKGRISDLFCSSSVVIRKEVFDNVGKFDERLKYSEDTDMWWRIIATYPVAFYDRYMVFYRFDAENRALNRECKLSQFLPYYVDKYRDPIYETNAIFYRYINRWSAQQIRKYYFADNKESRQDAEEAVKKIDYSVIPVKYRFLYKWPYILAVIVDKFDKLYHQY